MWHDLKTTSRGGIQSMPPAYLFKSNVGALPLLWPNKTNRNSGERKYRAQRKKRRNHAPLTHQSSATDSGRISISIICRHHLNPINWVIASEPQKQISFIANLHISLSEEAELWKNISQLVFRASVMGMFQFLHAVNHLSSLLWMTKHLGGFDTKISGRSCE